MFLEIWSTADIFFLIFDHLLPFYPPNNPENQNFEKMKKMPVDIIILHMKKMPGNIIISHKCTINDNYMMYDSWDTKCDRQNVLSFWAIFCPFTSLKAQKIKIQKNEKKQTWQYHHFTEVYQKSWSYATLFWDMAHDRCNYLSFWAIFCLFTFLTAQKIKILQKWKKHLKIPSFYTSVPKTMIICNTVPEIWHVTDVIIFHFGLFFALLPS